MDFLLGFSSWGRFLLCTSDPEASVGPGLNHQPLQRFQLLHKVNIIFRCEDFQTVLGIKNAYCMLNIHGGSWMFKAKKQTDFPEVWKEQT